MNNKTLSNLAKAAIIELLFFIAIFINNGQKNDALQLCIIGFGTLLLLYIIVKTCNKNKPFLLHKPQISFTLSIGIIGFMMMICVFSNYMFIKRSYKIGNIQVEFPKGDAMIYDFVDSKNHNYYIEYYNNYCSIELQKIHYNNNYSILENIKINERLEQVITDNIKVEDFYNSNFTEGTRSINKKEWSTYYTEIDKIEYTIYYIIIDNDIYKISTTNYNKDSKACNNNIDKTFESIKYKN